MKILAVIDLQRDFTTGVLGNEQTAQVAERAASRIKRLVEENANLLVFATFDTHSENYMDTQEGRNLPVPHCIKGSDGWRLDPIVEEALGGNYVPVEKLTFGAYNFPAEINAKADGEPVDEIILMGVCTDICVISNAMVLKAAFPEIPVRVIADCCAGVTPESHTNALNAMKMCQIIVEE